MVNALQVKKTPCYDESGYEFYPVRNYDSHSDDWMWVPEEYEEVFSEKSPFVKPELNDNGEMIGFSYVEKTFDLTGVVNWGCNRNCREWCVYFK